MTTPDSFLKIVTLPNGDVSGIIHARNTQHTQGMSNSDFDLSFMDLLSSWSLETQSAAPTELLNNVTPLKAKEKPAASDSSSASSESKSHYASSIQALQNMANVKDIRDVYDKDLAVLKNDLTSDDMAYLRQVVIPGLPILMGTVPQQNVFPMNEAGELVPEGYVLSDRMTDAITKGYKTGHPVRIDLDENSSIVLKIRNGQVSAEFLSADKAMALYMKQELQTLKNQMTEKNLPVGTLTYREQEPNQHQKQQQEEDDTES